MKRIFSLFLASTLFMLVSGQGFAQGGAKLSDAQLKKLVAPVALYPDPLLAQILPASTYPLQIVEAARIIHGSSDFSKIDSQNWEPSIKAVAHYPSVLQMMNSKLSWTQELGQAVISQQQDVLKAVQELRAEAKNTGNLQSNSQQKVQQTGEQIEIVPADPQVVYVPVYNPEIVYTQPYNPAVPLVTFGAGLAMGAWLGTGFYWPGNTLVYTGGYWGHGWNNVQVNNYYNHNNWVHNSNYDNNTFNRNNINSNNINRNNINSDHWNSDKWNNEFHNDNRSNTPFSKNDNLSSSHYASNHLGDNHWDSGDYGNHSAFGNNGWGDHSAHDSFRGFDSRGGGGFGGFGGDRGGGGFGGFHGGGGFRR